MFCVVVAFEVKLGFEDNFRQKVLANAATSLSTEAGCYHFDVCQGAASSNFLLYELYDSEEAFHIHLSASHFKSFDAETAGWVREKRVTTYTRLPN